MGAVIGQHAAPPPEPLLRLRPLGLGEILDDIFRVYRRHFWLLACIALILSVPGLALQLASGSADQFGFIATIFRDIGNPAALSAEVPPAPPNIWLLLTGYLLILIVVPFTLGGVSQAAIDLIQGREISVRSTLTAVGQRYWALLGLALLYVAITPTIICLPVLIWLGVRWSVAVPALLAERVGPVQALRRSWRLTRGSFWRSAGILLILYLLQTVAGSVLAIFAFPLAILVPFVPGFVRGAIVLTLTTGASALVLPIFYLGVVLLYFDLRIRREDFDLDQLARQAVPPAV
jgi:membrane-anchored glycerophosphoryl diester phosphodiesterase (GDPDase)